MAYPLAKGPFVERMFLEHGDPAPNRQARGASRFRPSRKEGGVSMSDATDTRKEPPRRQKVRHLPPICFLAANANLLIGWVRFPREHLGRVLEMDDGQRFTVFRHAHLKRRASGKPAVFVVRFKFARFSQAANRRLSIIPIPLIVGFPGFMDKLWMVNAENGYWQGVYQFESPAAVEAYRHSFVLGLMNRRAASGTLSEQVHPGTHLRDFLEPRNRL